MASPEPDDRAKVAVEDWLNTQGYPLEYRTYWALLRRFGGKCGIGSYVETKDGTPREVDVYAHESFSDDGLKHFFHLRLVCECKYSKDKPWVLLYGNTGKSNLFSEWVHTPRSKPLELIPNPSDVHLQELAKAFHFLEGGQYAHNIVQAFAKSNEPDRAYDSLKKITNAAWDYLSMWEDRLKITVYEMVFPCLIVSGPLFGAYFNPQTGHIIAKEIKIGRLCWQGCRNGTNVDVVHESALDEYADNVKDSFNAIMPVLKMLYGDLDAP